MSYAVIDLFAGAGGLGLGATKAGCDLRLSVELDKFACQTMEANKSQHPGKVICQSVTDLTGEEILDLANIRDGEKFFIVGGPPCQPFSKASYWTDPGHEANYRKARWNGEVLEKPAAITIAKEDKRRSLIFEFYRLILEANPDGFLFENVPSIMHPRNVGLFNEFKSSMALLGFHLRFLKVNGLDYGIAQKRQRIILLGSKESMPDIPKATHSDTDPNLPNYLTPGQVLKPFNSKRYFEEEEVVKGKWSSQFLEVPPGMNYKALTEWAGHPNPSFVAETRFWNFLLKLHPDKPSWTIAASPGPWTGPFHWNQRRLRIPELAVLQGFPADYEFVGSRREKIRQIGNALPSHIAKACIEALIN